MTPETPATGAPDDTDAAVEHWRTGWPTLPGNAPPGVEPDNYVYKFVLHAPIDRALRNHEVTEQHGRWAAAVAPQFPPGAPTWWHFARWSSAQVGELIRAPLPGNARLARALSVGNTLVYSNTATVAELITQPHEGDLPLPPPGTAPGRTAFLAYARGIALATYRAAAAVRDTDPDRSRELVALANLCLLAEEQESLDEAIAVAPRARLRQLYRFAFLDPRPSLREWRNEVPKPWWMRIENRLAPKLIALRPLQMPWGPIRIGDGVPGFRLPDPRPAMPEGLEQWHPFDVFPPNGSAPGCYLCLDERLSYLYALLWTHRDGTTWPALDTAPTWSRAERARDDFQARFARLPAPSSYATRAARAVPPAGVELSTDRRLRLADDSESSDDAIRIFDTAEARADLEIARRIYRANRSWIAIAFLARSIPASFAAADGAALLAPRTSGVRELGAKVEQRGRTMSGDAAWRAGGTLEFVDQVLGWSDARDDDPDRATDRLRSALLATRHKHHSYRDTLDVIADGGGAGASAAHRLRADKGVPVNVVDAVGVAATFTASIQQFFHDFVPDGVRDPAEWDAWARTWARVAVAIGAPVRALSTPGPDGRPELFDMATFTAVGEYVDALSVKPSVAGLFLMSNFLNDLDDAVPRWQRRFVRLGVQIFGDDRHLVPLMIHVGRWHRLARRAVRLLTRTPVLGRAWITGVEVMMRPLLAKLEALSGMSEAPLVRRFPPNCTTTDVSDGHRPA